ASRRTWPRSPRSYDRAPSPRMPGSTARRARRGPEEARTRAANRSRARRRSRRGARARSGTRRPATCVPARPRRSRAHLKFEAVPCDDTPLAGNVKRMTVHARLGKADRREPREARKEREQLRLADLGALEVQLLHVRRARGEERERARRDAGAA